MVKNNRKRTITISQTSLAISSRVSAAASTTDGNLENGRRDLEHLESQTERTHTDVLDRKWVKRY